MYICVYYKFCGNIPNTNTLKIFSKMSFEICFAMGDCLVSGGLWQEEGGFLPNVYFVPFMVALVEHFLFSSLSTAFGTWTSFDAKSEQVNPNWTRRMERLCIWTTDMMLLQFSVWVPRGSHRARMAEECERRGQEAWMSSKGAPWFLVDDIIFKWIVMNIVRLAALSWKVLDASSPLHFPRVLLPPLLSSTKCWTS